jgi:hypothetical protein
LRVLDHGAQAGAAMRRCSTLLQQEKITRQMCKASVWPRYEHVRTLLIECCPALPQQKKRAR